MTASNDQITTRRRALGRIGAIALATAGGTLAGTLAAMVILPALLVRKVRRPADEAPTSSLLSAPAPPTAPASA